MLLIVGGGPHDKDSSHSSQSLKWKVKRQTNDELRGKFIDMTVPQAEFLHLKVPDPDLKWNEKTSHYEHGKINWDEFYNVIKGKGPCNKERIGARIKADAEGKWVKEAALAYAAKHKTKN